MHPATSRDIRHLSEAFLEDTGARLRLPLALLLLLIAAGGAVDLALDQPAEWLSFHAVYEIALVLGGLGTATWLWRGWRSAEQENRVLRTTLETRQAERDLWRASAEQSLAGLSSAIEAQFDRWELTPAEREVALQLLLGRSHKEIAARSARSERTIRQHAASAYEKAGLGGRAELSAFFLEGLLPQPGAAGAPARPNHLPGGSGSTS